jgi:hypothetical protein
MSPTSSDPIDDPSAAPRRSPGRRRRRQLLAAVGSVVVVWSAIALWQLAAGVLALRAGSQDLRAVRREATVEQLLEPSTAERLDDASAHFAEADDRVSGPLLAPMRVLPIVGRHVQAVDRLAEAGEDGAAIATDALAELQALAERPTSGGPDRIETLRDLAELGDAAAVDLDAIDPGPSDALVGLLGEAVAEVADQRTQAAEAGRRLADTSRQLATLLEGPEPYLLLGANNAEMRAGTGMYLSAAELRFDDGRLALGDVRPTAELVLPEGAVPVDGDLGANWGWLDPGRDLRQLGVSADLPQSAEVAVRTWAAIPGTEPVAGVIAIDVDGLRNLLRVVGPVEVDGVRYTADTVRGELLRQQYGRFDDREERRDQLGAVARAVFERIEGGAWELPVLATQLSDAVAGRHLVVWSADPEAQEVWSDLGADGHLEDRSVSVALVNRSANKLDSWIETSADLATTRTTGGRRQLTVTYEIANTSPATGAPYVVGPNIEGLAAGDHRALVVVNLPAGSTDVRIEGARPFLEGGDGPTLVTAGEVTVPAGATATVTVTALLADGVDEIVLEPSARIPRTRWVVEGEAIDRDRRRTVELGGG